MQKSEFQKYATKHLGMNSLALEQYMAQNSYISPSILEERQLNVTQMDVFSRLMMDRIIFLGTPIDDYVANVIQAQLLFGHCANGCRAQHLLAQEIRLDHCQKRRDRVYGLQRLSQRPQELLRSLVLHERAFADPQRREIRALPLGPCRG